MKIIIKFNVFKRLIFFQIYKFINIKVIVIKKKYKYLNTSKKKITS
jgi:hypothetical protein